MGAGAAALVFVASAAVLVVICVAGGIPREGKFALEIWVAARDAAGELAVVVLLADAVGNFGYVAECCLLVVAFRWQNKRNDH